MSRTDAHRPWWVAEKDGDEAKWNRHKVRYQRGQKRADIDMPVGPKPGRMMAMGVNRRTAEREWRREQW